MQRRKLHTNALKCLRLSYNQPTLQVSHLLLAHSPLDFSQWAHTHSFPQHGRVSNLAWGLSSSPFSYLSCLFLDRLALNSRCSQEWLWTSDLPAFTSAVLGWQVCTITPSLCGAGLEPMTPFMLGEHSSHWATSPALVFGLSLPSIVYCGHIYLLNFFL